MELDAFLGDLPRGSTARFAADLGISTVYLRQLASGRRVASPELAVLIEQRSFGKVTRPELRPADWSRIWPELN